MPASTSSWSVTPEKITAVVDRLARYARPSRIIVFSSAARGEVRPDSDLDLLVVMPHKVPDWRRASVEFQEQLRGLRVATDILVISEEEASRAVGNRYGVLGHALREGKLVYEASR